MAIVEHLLLVVISTTSWGTRYHLLKLIFQVNIARPLPAPMFLLFSSFLFFWVDELGLGFRKTFIYLSGHLSSFLHRGETSNQES